MSKDAVENYINNQKYNVLQKTSQRALNEPIRPMTKVTEFPAEYH